MQATKALYSELVHSRPSLLPVAVVLLLLVCKAPFSQALDGEPVKKGDAPVSTTAASSLSTPLQQQQQQQHYAYGDKKPRPNKYGNDSGENDEKLDSHVIYDQRQSGKYNIHVSIKDVAIIEMDDNEIEDSSYDDNDYYYDESDFTVKPILLNPNSGNKTTTTTTTTTTTPTASTATTPSTAATKTTVQEVSTSKINGAKSNFTTTSPLVDNPRPIDLSIAEPDADLGKLKYSPNLLADIAAAQGSQHSPKGHLRKQSTLSLIPLPTKKVQSVVILDTRTEASSDPRPTDLSATTLRPLVKRPNLLGRSKAQDETPVISEPVLHPRPHSSASHVPMRETPAKYQENESNDSKIYKFKAQQQQQQQQKQQQQQMAQNFGLGNSLGAPAYPLPLFSLPIRRCRSNQYRDMNGNCRARRSRAHSASLLRKLFHMLISLPLAHERQSPGNDDEASHNSGEAEIDHNQNRQDYHTFN